MKTLKKIVFAAGLLVALLLVAKGAGAQQVNVKSFPGNSVGEKLTAAAALTSAGGGCVSGLTCILILPPEMSVYATGTLPTMGAAQMTISYMDPSAVKVIATGANTLTALGGSFTGGTVANPIAMADSVDCAAGHPGYGFTNATTGGLSHLTGTNVVMCAAGFDVAEFTGATNALLLRQDGCIGWGANTVPIGSINLSLCWGANGRAEIKGATADTVYRAWNNGNTKAADFSIAATCAANGANNGILCYDTTLNKWRVSENNGAIANLVGATGGFALAAGCSGAMTASSQTPMSMFGAATTSNTCTAVAEAAAQEMPVPKASTLTGIASSVSASGTTTGTAAVFKNGASVMTCTMGSGIFVCNNSGSVSFALGDTVGLVYTTGAATAQQGGKITAFFTVP